MPWSKLPEPQGPPWGCPMANEHIPFPAKVLNALATLGLIGVVVLFLSPLVLMLLHHMEVQKAEREWQEVVRRENAKTEKTLKSWQDAINRANAEKTAREVK